MTKHASNKASLSKAENMVSQNSEIEKEISQDCETLPAGTDNAGEGDPYAGFSPAKENLWPGVPPIVQGWAESLGFDDSGINASPCGHWWAYVSTEGTTVAGRLLAPQDPTEAVRLNGVSPGDLTRYALASIGARAGKRQSGLARFPALGTTAKTSEKKAALLAAMKAKYPHLDAAMLESMAAMALEMAKPQKKAKTA